MAVIILQDNQVARQVNRKNKTTMACINLVLEFSISSFYILSRKKKRCRRRDRRGGCEFKNNYKLGKTPRNRIICFMIAVQQLQLAM